MHVPPQRWLVAWFSFTLNGGLNRFAEVARVMARQGHQVEFLSLTNETHSPWPDFPTPIRTWEELTGQRFDAVMIPGAGVDDERLARLAWLRDSRFGRRVQHLLNEPARLARFQVAHRYLQPHDVVANNGAWRLVDLLRLPAERHLILPGAVEAARFAPPPTAASDRGPPWRVGGYSAKNPAALLAAVEYLARPNEFELHWFGLPLVDDGLLAGVRRRLNVVEHGPLFGAELARFYHQCDVFVTTETCAGWCNAAAEAAAAGRATVVTPHGTWEFARHGQTAWVLAEPEPRAIAEALTHLTGYPALREQLGRRAAATMRKFSWENYTTRLLEFVARPAAEQEAASPTIRLLAPHRSPTRETPEPTTSRRVA